MAINSIVPVRSVRRSEPLPTLGKIEIDQHAHEPMGLLGVRNDDVVPENLGAGSSLHERD